MDEPRSRPLVIYDGSCGLCESFAARHRESAPGVVFVPAGELELGELGVDPELAARSVILLETDGRQLSGAAAVFRLLAEAGRPWGQWLYRRLPGFALISEWIYRRVAAHRHRPRAPGRP